ncbi:endoplasmic reticulum junction formation protein lunapark-B-like [Aplochiton taeniatus]
MGAVISRWRVKPTTVDLLENLDKDIKDLEEFRTKNQRLLKLWVGRLLVYSSVLYLLSCVWVYCLYLPEQWRQRLAMSVPLLLFPGLVWCLRKLLIFIFSKRTERNNDKLEDLKVEKRKILEQVMETETYKNAKLILERFDPEARRKAELESTPVRPQVTPRPGQELRHRGGGTMRPAATGTPITMTMTPAPGPRPPMGPAGTPTERGLTAAEDSFIHQGAPRRPPPTMTHSMPIYRPGPGMQPPGPPLSRPILPRERGTVDRVIEYLVGDGPQNRYALICQQCFSHNGMALREEFEYLAFRCAYCYFLNPARKTRPQAPRLPEFSFERRLRSDSPSPGPAPQSGVDTEDSAPPSGGTEKYTHALVPPAVAPWSSVHSFSSSLQRRPHQNPGVEEELTEGAPHSVSSGVEEELTEGAPHSASSGVEEELQPPPQEQE